MRDVTLINVLSKRILTCEKLHPSLLGNPEWQDVLNQFRNLSSSLSSPAKELGEKDSFIQGLTNLERRINNLEEYSRLKEHN